MGRGIALALAEAGAAVVVAARRAETGDPVAAEVRERGVAGICIETDVADRAAVDATVARTVAELGRLDIMIHNAIKAPSPHRVESVGIEQWEELSTVTVWGSLYCARSAYPHLKASGHGRLDDADVAGGCGGQRRAPALRTGEGGAAGHGQEPRPRWGPDGITVNCIGPVAVTPTLEKAFAENPELRGRIEARTPLRRLGDPEQDIGGVAAFLASDAAGYVTGQTIICDGGSFTGL